MLTFTPCDHWSYVSTRCQAHPELGFAAGLTQTCRTRCWFFCRKWSRTFLAFREAQRGWVQEEVVRDPCCIPYNMLKRPLLGIPSHNPVYSPLSAFVVDSDGCCRLGDQGLCCHVLAPADQGSGAARRCAASRGQLLPRKEKHIVLAHLFMSTAHVVVRSGIDVYIYMYIYIQEPTHTYIYIYISYNSRDVFVNDRCVNVYACIHVSASVSVCVHFSYLFWPQETHKEEEAFQARAWRAWRRGLRNLASGTIMEDSALTAEMQNQLGRFATSA